MNEIFSEQDFKEVQKITALINRISHADFNYADQETTKIHRHQPFLISLILGYRLEVNPKELEIITHCIFVIWEFFKTDSRVLNMKITKEQFEKMVALNQNMLIYFDKENDAGRKNLVASDISNLRSKALYAGVMKMMNITEWQDLPNTEDKTLRLLSMKSLIQCFENITP